jgi:glycerophosphoryl diester phosphodiesterase
MNDILYRLAMPNTIEPRTQPRTPTIVAHRGASKAAKENTIEAFHLARTMGAAMVELDVRRTSDNALAVHHDPHIDGVAIVSMTRAELPTWVPLLHEALDACEGMEVNIEIKNDQTEVDFDETRSLVPAVIELLRIRGDGDRMLISSFDRETVRAVRAQEPTLRTGYLFTIPELPLDKFMAGIAAEGHVAIHPNRYAAVVELCDAAHRVGLAVNVWTVDKPEEMLKLAANGVDAIITNVPDVAVATFSSTSPLG